MSGAALTAADVHPRTAARVRSARPWWMAGAAVLLLAITVQPFRDPDVWWHLALGRYIVEHGIPAHEPFSFLTAANPWVHQQWLYEIALYRVVTSGPGGAGIASLLMGGVACGALVLAALAVPRMARVRGGWLAVAMLASGLVMAEVVGVRGQVLTLLGTAVVLLVVTRWREGHQRALWALPPLFLVWANLHAGFVVGFIVLGIAFLAPSPLAPRDRVGRRALALATLGSAVATLVNPAGPGLYVYVAETFLNPTLTSAITEWMSPDFHVVWVQLFEAEVMIVVLLWAAGGGPRIFDLLLTGVALAATLQAQRNVSLFAVVAVPQMALYGSQAWRLRVEPALQRRRIRPPRTLPPVVAAAAVACLGLVVALSSVLPNISPASTNSFEASRYPEAAATYVGAHLAGRRLYTIDIWGGYLAWRFPEGRVVFLYGETGAFGAHDLQLYEDIHLLAPDWTNVLRRYSIADAVVGLHTQEASGFHALSWKVDCYDAASDSVVMSAPRGATRQNLPPLRSAPASAPRC